VLCKLAAKNKIGIGFSFYDVLNAKDRAKVLGRMMLNVKLCKKYKVNIVLGSFAKDKYDLRLRRDLEAFGRLIGIDKLDNKKIFKLKDVKDVKVN
jgi:RNase P/RNase MRP subunit p30